MWAELLYISRDLREIRDRSAGRGEQVGLACHIRFEADRGHVPQQCPDPCTPVQEHGRVLGGAYSSLENMTPRPRP